MGETGAGKSTIAYLLLRLYEYNKGSITIDGIELNNINRKWIREHIGIVLQEPYFFSKSIYENINLGKVEAKRNEIEQVAKIAHIQKTILKFKEGYDTLIGIKGITF